jgi:hypothetical protein
MAVPLQTTEMMDDDTLNQSQGIPVVKNNLPDENNNNNKDTVTNNKGGCCYSPLLSVSCPKHHHDQQLEMAITSSSSNTNTKYQKQILHHAMELADTVQHSERGCEFVINTLICLKRFFDQNQQQQSQQQDILNQSTVPLQLDTQNSISTCTTGTATSTLGLPRSTMIHQPSMVGTTAYSYLNTSTEIRHNQLHQCTEQSATTNGLITTSVDRRRFGPIDVLNQTGTTLSKQNNNTNEMNTKDNNNRNDSKKSTVQEYEEWMTFVPTLFNDDEFVASLGLDQE